MAAAQSVAALLREHLYRSSIDLGAPLLDSARYDADDANTGQDRADLHVQLINIIDQLQAGRPQEACRQLAILFELHPNHVDVQQVYAIALARIGESERAFELFEDLLSRYDRHMYAPRIRSHYAAALRDAGHWQEALLHYQRALEVCPGDVPILNGLGNTLRDLGRWKEAEEAFSAALKSQPNSSVLLNNLGTCLQHAGKARRARTCFEKALEHEPSLADAWYNLGNLNQEEGHIADALRDYAEALAIQPRLLPALSALTRLMQQTCEWDGLDWLEGQVLNHVRDGRPGAVFPFGFLALDGSTSADQLQCAERWRIQQYLPLLQSTAPVRRSSVTHEGKIRIGYLSSDFHEHATMHLGCEVFELHDRDRFEIIAYSAGPNLHSATRKRVKQAFDQFIDVRDLSLPALAQRISSDRIDILVDMNGYTRNSRSGVLALHPAPVQVSWLGYPGTLGHELADYIIADQIVAPMSEARHFGEKFAWMPFSYQSNDRQRAVAEMPTRESCGLPEDKTVFCCFNHAYKITPTVFQLWCDILTEVPDSVLWLLSSTQLTQDNLRMRAEQAGIDPSRLIFAKVVKPDQHRARLALADIFLDTLPYNAHTTCSDALWAGVPVIAMSGKTFAGRVSHSLLAATGLEALVADSPEAYKVKAVLLAQDPSLRAEVKKVLSLKDALPLFDTPRFVESMEKLYLQMWQRAAKGMAPAHICPDGAVGQTHQEGGSDDVTTA
ncbi:tetratricopeptide repeat protein [Burkholderiaceae bacterium DAT-1]|nr:tetratricopeptide repeat protein [Burkholderiaceae bacterium DAT-1]